MLAGRQKLLVATRTLEYSLEDLMPAGCLFCFRDARRGRANRCFSLQGRSFRTSRACLADRSSRTNRAWLTSRSSRTSRVSLTSRRGFVMRRDVRASQLHNSTLSPCRANPAPKFPKNLGQLPPRNVRPYAEQTGHQTYSQQISRLELNG